MGKRHERDISPKRIYKWQIYIWKKCSTSLAIGKCKLKPHEYYDTSIRMAKIKNSDNTKRWQGCGETESLLHRWCASKVVQPLWKTVWQLILMKLNMQLPYNPAIALTSEHLSLKNEHLHLHENLYTNIHNCFICNSQKLETNQMSFSRWLVKQSSASILRNTTQG